MTYDPVDTNDDGVVDADVDNDSVSTDALDSAIRDYDDVTSTRTAGTTYQNTTGHLLEISLNIKINSGDKMNAVLLASNTNSFAVARDKIDQKSLPDIGGQAAFVLRGIVPDQAYYKVSLFEQSTIPEWREREWST